MRYAHAWRDAGGEVEKSRPRVQGAVAGGREGLGALARALPKHLRPRREKIFGLARRFPHDRNARVWIQAYLLAWNAKHKQEGQHQGPITAAHTSPPKIIILDPENQLDAALIRFGKTLNAL